MLDWQQIQIYPQNLTKSTKICSIAIVQQVCLVASNKHVDVLTVSDHTYSISVQSHSISPFVSSESIKTKQEVQIQNQKLSIKNTIIVFGW